MKKVILYIAFVLSFYSCEKTSKKHFAYVYGHGGTSIYPEKSIHPANTKESILYALDALDADGVEVDVQMTKDSVFVLFHDGYLDLLTDSEGCIGDKDWSEIQDISYYDNRYQIVTLKEVVDLSMERGKKLFLDMKPLNFCSGEEISNSSLNYALDHALGTWGELYRSNITFNSRSINIINSIEDTLIKKCFETEDIQLGVDYFQLYSLDKLSFFLNKIDEDLLPNLRDLDIPYTIVGIKTQKDVKHAHSLFPYEVISDNVAYSKKQSN